MTKHDNTVKLVFAGGGTGGHLYPAIAIADRLAELLRPTHEVEIHFVGTRRGIEYRLQDTIGYPLHFVNMQGISRTLTLRNLLVPFIVMLGLWQSWRLMRHLKPDVVIGTGGYVSWPVLKAAQLSDLPTAIQEQNSFPGIATRRLAGAAKAVYLGFDDARRFLPSNAKCMLTGNPVRTSLAGGDRREALRAFGLDESKKTILVFGGSQGAHAINEAILQQLAHSKIPDTYQLLWITGKREYTEVHNRAGEMAAHLALFPYEHRMHLVYAAADVAIARAGALTLAELEMCRVPAVLVPYPHAAGDHQRKNAESYAALGFADVVVESQLSTIPLLSQAVAIVESGRADRMRAAIRDRNAGRQASVDLIAQDIINRFGLEAPKTPDHPKEHHANS